MCRGTARSTWVYIPGINDPAAVFLTIVLTGLVLGMGDETPALTLLSTLLRQAVLGAGLGLAGGFAIVWVLNRADGRVEAYIEGEADTVTRVERALRRGPRGGRVDEVDATSEPPSGKYLDFEIR